MSNKVYDADEPLIVDERSNKRNLSCAQLMEMTTYSVFNVEKLSYRLNVKCLPIWRERTLILACGFIFKYGSPNGLLLKGVPIDLTRFSLDKNCLEYGANSLCLSSLSKQYVFRFSDPETVEQFQLEIAKQREWRIKSQLRHVSVSSSEQYVITFAETLCSSKDRINKLMHQNRMSSVEFDSMGVLFVCFIIISINLSNKLCLMNVMNKTHNCVVLSFHWCTNN